LPADNNESFVNRVASEHDRRLKAFLSRRLRNPLDAHDLAQEVYLRLLLAQRLDAIRNPEAYLLTVASHLIHEHAIKTASVPPLVCLDDPETVVDPVSDEDPGAQAEMRQRLYALERALGKMSPKAAAALVLHRRDGFPLDEVAVELRLSRSMVKKHLVNALSKCRQYLERLERPGRLDRK
jgi:RNA polymerase sigma factor (sigma-70 family)